MLTCALAYIRRSPSAGETLMKSSCWGKPVEMRSSSLLPRSSTEISQMEEKYPLFLFVTRLTSTVHQQDLQRVRPDRQGRALHLQRQKPGNFQGI